MTIVVENIKIGEYLLTFEGTLEDYYKLEEKKAEYIDGIIIMHSPASVTHERISVEILTRLNLFVKSNSLGEVLGSKLAIAIGDRRFEPDIVFISRDNSGKFGEFKFFGIPDLVVEIISKSTKHYDLKIKREFYREHKIPEIWFVDYNEKIFIADILKSGGYETVEINDGMYESAVLKGFKLRLWDDLGL